MEDEGDIGWTARETVAAEPSQESIVQKQETIKEILTLQDGLKALLNKIDATDAECTKLNSHNETMSLYIDNLTRNKLLFAGSPR